MRLQKACRSYAAWKENHSPEMKPWLNPDQNSLPPLNPSDIGKWELTASAVIDERDAVEGAPVADGIDEGDESSGSADQPAASQATSDRQRGTVEQVENAMPSASAIPSDPAVVAGAN